MSVISRSIAMPLVAVGCAGAVAIGCSAVLGMDAPALDPCANGCAGDASLDGAPGGDRSGDDAGGEGAGDGTPPPPADAPDGGLACPPGAFCDDFEHDDKLGKWDAIYEVANGTFVVDSTRSTSPTRSSRVDLTATTAAVAVQLSKTLATASSAILSVSLRIDVLPTSSTQIEEIVFGDPNGDAMQVGLAFSSVGVSLAEDGTLAAAQYIEHPLSVQPKLGQWQRFEVEVHLATNPASATVRIDGVVAFTGALQDGFTTSPVNMFHGADAPGPTDPWQFWADDLVMLPQ